MCRRIVAGSPLRLVIAGWIQRDVAALRPWLPPSRPSRERAGSLACPCGRGRPRCGGGGPERLVEALDLTAGLRFVTRYRSPFRSIPTSTARSVRSSSQSISSSQVLTLRLEPEPAPVGTSGQGGMPAASPIAQLAWSRARAVGRPVRRGLRRKGLPGERLDTTIREGLPNPRTVLDVACGTGKHLVSPPARGRRGRGRPRSSSAGDCS